MMGNRKVRSSDDRSFSETWCSDGYGIVAQFEKLRWKVAGDWERLRQDGWSGWLDSEKFVKVSGLSGLVVL